MAWFEQLNQARQAGLNMPQPIGWQDISAWAALSGVQPQPWEAALLRDLDTLWRSAWVKGREKKPDPSQRK